MISVGNGIAIYGALVATGVFIWDIVKNRPKIKIEIWGIKDRDGQGYTVYARINNLSDHPIKLDSYGFLGEKTVVSSDIDEERKRVPEKDHIMFTFPIHALSLNFKDGTVSPLKFFYIEDRTGKWHKKKIPDYIIDRAISSSKDKVDSG